MIHIIIAKAALFMVSGISQRITGTNDLHDQGSLYKGFPLLALLFLLPALSLGGIPPLSGFWAKLSLVRAALEAGQYWIVLAALSVSLLTLFSMLKIWNEAFWKDSPRLSGEETMAVARAIPRDTLANLVIPLAVLVVFVVGIGLLAGPVMSLAFEAAEQLMTPELYIQAVLGDAS
jgi:multicomponent Na+:H+ antiporter subunit D